MKVIQIILTVILIFFSFIGCSRGKKNTSFGNPLVSLSVGTSASSSDLKSLRFGSFAVSGVQFCFKRLRFKKDSEETNSNPTLDEDNIDINIGLFDITQEGNLIASVNVATGLYTRIEFDLEKDCEELPSPSVVFDNDNDGGTPFETEDRISIRFDGSIQIDEDINLNLYFDSILTALDAVVSANQIKTSLESSSSDGTFD